MTVRQLERELARLEKKSARLAAARAALPPGSTRARVTSANARWARVAEARDGVARELSRARIAAAIANNAADFRRHDP